MRKRLTMALAAGALTAAMLPATTAADTCGPAPSLMRVEVAEGDPRDRNEDGVICKIVNPANRSFAEDDVFIDGRIITADSF